MYKVIKVLNNSAILAACNHEEVIIMAKGIGFAKKTGDVFEMPPNAKTFAMQKNYKFKNVIDHIEPVYLEIASEIIKEAASQFGNINDDILLPLADHIFYAIKRMNENIMPSNPFKNDIRLLFPEEYEVAKKGKDIIQKYISQSINDDEVGFITLHIHSAVSSNKVVQSMEATRVIHEAIVKLENDLNIVIDVQSISYVRLMNHIKFLILRLNTNEKLQMDISEFTKEKFPFAYEQASYMCRDLSHVLQKELPEQEIGYLALHLDRILSSTIK